MARQLPSALSSPSCTSKNKEHGQSCYACRASIGLCMSLTGKYKTPRKEERFITRVPVLLRVGQTNMELFTGDVSYRGLYVCTDTPPVLRQLIRIEAMLPPDQSRFLSHGMSVFGLGPGNSDGRLPGIGIQFYAQSATNRRIWERFVDSIKHAPLEVPADAIDSVKRMHPRVDARFEVRPSNVDELHSLFSRDISQGGMFLETDRAVEIGRSLALTIIHPLTRRSFSIDSVVRRCSTSPQGVGVEFVELTDKRRLALEQFILQAPSARS